MKAARWSAAALLLAAAPAAAETGVTDREVLLGMPAAFSGASAGLGVEHWRGALAAFDEANRAGGVHGRKLKLVLADNAYSPQRAPATLLHLVLKERVFAIFGGVGTGPIVQELPLVLKFFQSGKLFYFANVTGAQPQREPPYDVAVMNVRASYRQETRAIVDAFVALGRRRIGVFVQDDAFGASGRDGVKRALAAHGLSLTAEAVYRRGATFEGSMKPQVDVLLGARVEAVVAVGSYQACAALVRDARAGGLMVPIHNLSFVGADQMLALLREAEAGGRPLTENLVFTQVVPSYADLSLPLVKEYRAAMDAQAAENVEPGVGDGSYKPKARYSFGSLEGYVNAKAFLAVLEKAGADLTRKAFLDAAAGMGRFDLGLGVPAELSATRRQVLDKVWFAYVGPEGWVTTDDLSGVLR